MVNFCKDHSSDTFIILTESGMMHRLTHELPDKTFIAGRTGNCACNDCRFMKMNTIPKLLECLKDGRPSIEMDAELIRKAKLPIERMLEWSWIFWRFSLLFERFDGNGVLPYEDHNFVSVLVCVSKAKSAAFQLRRFFLLWNQSL